MTKLQLEQTLVRIVILTVVPVFTVVSPVTVVAQQEPAAGAVEGSDGKSAYLPANRDAIDAAAPNDVKAAKRLQQAEGLIRAGRFDRVLEVLLYTLDRADGALVRLGDGRMSPVVNECHRLMGALPPATLDLYRRRYGPAAEKALSEAISSGRREAVEQVATQFRHTAAGGKALRLLAAIHFDRGEFGLAALRYRELPVRELDPSIRLKASFAAVKSGQTDLAKEFLGALSEAEQDQLGRRHAGGIDIEAVLVRAETPDSHDEVRDWSMPFGNPTATAIAEGGEPIMLRRWHHPLTHREPLASQIDRLTADLRDAGKATIPAVMPLAIGDRVITRTMRGVSVFSIGSGASLWESEEGFSLERQWSDGTDGAIDPEMRQALRFRGQFGPDPSTRMLEHQPLPNSLYRDGVSGQLSSDGQRLYVVEPSESHGASNDYRENNGFGGALPTGNAGSVANRLVAYDLETGRLAWPDFGGLGGDLADGPFEPPLAGYYFFGPPIRAGADLLVVGEYGKQIRLVALDPSTGQMRWHQPVAEAQVGVEADPVRRLWPIQPSVSEGIVVCPTNVGWLVALEQSSRSVLWAERYAPVRESGDPLAQSTGAPVATLNSRWGSAAPIIAGGRVYFTPPEEAQFCCRDLFTGKLVWQRPKRTGLYVAGILDDLLIVVGSRSVDGVGTQDGVTRWSVSLPDGVGAPSGRSVLTGSHLYVPLRGERLLSIDVARGTIERETELPPGEGSLGNLILQGGTLLSLSSDGITAFEERSQLVRDIDADLLQNPENAISLLHKAQLQHAEGELELAAETIDRMNPAVLNVDDRERFRQLRWATLTSLIESDPGVFESRLNALQDLAQTPEEQFLVRRLTADRQLSESRYTDAAQSYLALLSNDGSRILSEEGSRRSLTLDSWLSGRLGDLWQGADASSRDAVQELFRKTLENTPDAERSRVAGILSFHPAAAEFQAQIASEEIAAGQLSAGELRLLRLARDEDDLVAGQACLALASLAQQNGLVRDCRYWSERAFQRKANIDPENGGTLAAEIAAERDQPSAVEDVCDWGDYRFSVVRSGGYFAPEQSMRLRPDHSELPFFLDRGLRLVQPDRLVVPAADGVGIEQMIPLHVGNHSGANAAAIAEGHLLFLAYRGVLQAVSMTEGRVLWSTPFADDAARRFSREESVAAMRPAGALTASSGLLAQARSRGAIVIANASYVATQGRRELTVRDPLTGKPRWSRSDLKFRDHLVGTESLLYSVSTDGRRGRILRLVDGKEIERPAALSKIGTAIASVGDRLLLATEQQSFQFLGLRAGGGSVLSLYDPLDDRVVWSETFPADTLFDLAADGSLLILNSDEGQLSRLEIATGERTLLASVPPQTLRRRSDVVHLEDANMIYVIVNVGRVDSSFGDLSAITVNGEIFAFDKAEGGLRWRREISRRRLLCEDFRHSPVLLFADNERTQKAHQDVWRVNLFAIDKQSGEQVLDEPLYMSSPPAFRGFSVDAERRSIDLTAYNARLRLQAVQAGDAAVPEAAGSP